jgi:CelD/BcsL family acetyltransferase involved in cellulose biosynthesis
MQLDVIGPDALSAELAALWQDVQDGAAELRHPMLSAPFVQCVARFRTDVRVGVVHDGGTPIGFFPWQSEDGRTGFPVGFRLNDWQAAVLPRDAQVDARWLLRACGLRTWHFDHLLASQPFFSDGHFVREPSPYIDLSGGLDSYLSDVAGRVRWKSHTRNARMLERDVGPVRFELHSTDETAFRALIEWKTQQLRRHGRRCVFDWPWVRDSLEEMRRLEHAACAGALSALYAGDRLAAVHFGLRSRDVLHWWITAYDPALGRYSPGALLLVRVIEESARQGVQRIELGKGPEPYKEKFQSGAVDLASGAVSASATRQLLQRTLSAAQERIRTSPLGVPAKRLLYWVENRGNRSRTTDAPRAAS